MHDVTLVTVPNLIVKFLEICLDKQMQLCVRFCCFITYNKNYFLENKFSTTQAGPINKN